jgi:hypothetical protein
MMLKSLGAVITAARERVSELVVGLSLATVSVATGFISYTHISTLTQDYWQNWKTAHLMPLAVDGQIVIGSVYFMEHSGERRRWLGLLGVVPGILESLYSNWESVAPPPDTPWLVSLEAHFWATVPAQAFACSTILFERWLHSRRARREAERPSAASVIAASHLAMARIAGQLSPQAPEPVAPAAQDAPALVHVTARPEGAPWGLVSPAAAPARPAVPAMSIPTFGPVMTIPQRPARQRTAPMAAAPDTRQPWPDDEAERTRLVNSMTRNELWRTYQLSKHAADKAREQYLAVEEADEEVA